MSFKKVYFLIIGIIACFTATSQTLPPVPKRITMFNMNLVLADDTRRTIEKEMAFLASKRVYVEAKMEKMAIYFPIIETIFEQENIPKDFKYLCAQESSFIADAVSTSNAVGFWQFKAGTAIDYGLRVDDLIDERKNIIASTRAAAKYLKNNNKIYQNWVSTLLSYRLGLTGAKNQVPASWTNATEITINNDIDWYVIRNIAHYIFFENELVNFTPNGSYLYLFNNASGKTFYDLAQEITVSETELKKENPWCTTPQIPSDKTYTAYKLIKKLDKVPVLSQNTMINKPFFDIEVGYPILKIDERKSKKTGAIFYTINGKKGILSVKDDTGESLAERAELKLQYLLSYNDIDKNDAIKPQMVYYLEKKNRKGSVPKHIVKKGQSIWLISQMYGIRESRLLRMNRMKKSDALQEGRILNLNERRGRKEEVEFVRKPFDNEQLPTEAPRIIIQNSNDTFPTKIGEKDSEVDLTIKTDTLETPIYQEPATTYSSGTQMKVVVRESGVVTSKAEPKAEPTPVVKSKETNLIKTDPNQKYVIVNTGDNLFNIAKKYNITVTDLKRVNGLTTNTVELGQKLFLPETNIKSSENTYTAPKTILPKVETPKPVAPKTESQNTIYHTVVAGETLYRVSVINKVSVDQIKKLNNLTDNTISVGQKLIIKK
jgi:membrane-bound lytic murein transglycosylase D